MFCSLGATSNDTTSTTTSVPGSKKLPPLPEIPKPVPKPRPREKKMYIAAYDYKPCEEGDLELMAVGLLFHNNEPPRGKTNNVVSEQVRHKPTRTVTEDSEKHVISYLGSRGIVLSM